MPRTSHSGRGIGPFHDCDRCGFTYRVSDLQREPGTSKVVCETCVDDPIALQRPIMIQDLLNFTAGEELRLAEILKENNTDDIIGIGS